MDRQQCPFETECSANSIEIAWQGQHEHFGNYIVKYRPKESKEVFAAQRTSERKIHISNLKNGTLYEIKIYVEDSNGGESLLFKTDTRTVHSIAAKIMKSAAKISDNPDIYRLRPVKITKVAEGVQVHEFFSDVSKTQERSLLLFGASGSGKSTLVDAIINYVTDVSFADNFRFKITDEENTFTHQEDDIICYKIRCQIGFKVGFNLNVIDVPGFKSEYNESIFRKLFALFQSVRFIGAACLVVPSFRRLTEEHRLIFNNILSIFGNDINYLIPLITFDDGGEIKALSSLKAAKVPYVEHMHFRFNNSQLLSGKEHVEVWNRRQIAMNNLFGEPTVFDNFSTDKTREVIKSRAKLYQHLNEAKSQMQQIERRENMLKMYDQRDMQPQCIQRSVESKILSRTVCINCKACNKTCIFDCSSLVKCVWYFVIFLEKILPIICLICIGCNCSCCLPCKCKCKGSFCCCIKCLQKLLGCTCSCSFAHHDKEYGRCRESTRDILQNKEKVQNIEDQNDCEIINNDEKIQTVEETLALMNNFKETYGKIARHAECLRSIALFNELPEEMENVRKFQERF